MCKEYYIKGFLDLDTQAAIILKAEKIGYDAAFAEYGAGTFITFIKKS
jgi:hypothetical protein